MFLSNVIKNINQNRIAANRLNIHKIKKIKSIREEMQIYFPSSSITFPKYLKTVIEMS